MSVRGASLRHHEQRTGPLGHVHRRPEPIHRMPAGPHPGQRHPLDHDHREPTVTANPRRLSQYAAAGSATLAPEISTRGG